jgi:hypothetical protein
VNALVLWLCRQPVRLWVRTQQHARRLDRFCERHIVTAYDRLCAQEARRP